MLSREALVVLWLLSMWNACFCAREHYQQEERRAPPRVLSLTVVAKVPGSPSPLSLSSLWGLAARPAVGPGPGGGLHKVVGDLPLVLKQVFCLSAVRITCDGGEKTPPPHPSEESGDYK